MKKENYMKKLITPLLSLALAACAAQPILTTPTRASTEEVIQPTQTPAVIVQTVVVTVIPTDRTTDVPTHTPPPTATPLPPPTEVPATQPPAEPATAAPVQAADGGLVTLESALGGGWFSAMTLTAKTLALRCELYKQITFTVTPSDPNISQVDFYYRIQDRATGAVFDWQGPRRMTADANGDFTLTFGGQDVNSNFRKPNAWLDFQFVGLGKSGGRVGSSEKIVQQVSYTFDCP